MTIQDPLLQGKLICLAAIDHDKDPEIEARWTNDPQYLQLLDSTPARPLSPAQIKKKYEAIEKEQEESRSLFYFTIRDLKDDRLIGLAKIYWVDWTNSDGKLTIGIGDPADRNQGIGTEVLNILLRFCFTELNLFRVTAIIQEYNHVAQHIFLKAGFQEEVRRREAIYRYGKRWDVLHYGLLKDEWVQQKGGAS